jgi:hypothetical protein
MSIINAKKASRIFNGMSYRLVQGDNFKKRKNLDKEDQQWLKINGYKNVGWDSVINLYHKIEEFLEREKWKDLSLEELFLAADRIGNKYLTHQEIADFDRRLSQEVNEIAEEIDRQFPDTETEVIDFSNNSNNNSQKSRSKRNLKLVKPSKR